MLHCAQRVARVTSYQESVKHLSKTVEVLEGCVATYYTVHGIGNYTVRYHMYSGRFRCCTVRRESDYICTRVKRKSIVVFTGLWVQL